MKKNYDYADDVLNISGADWPGAEMVSRPRTSTAPPPGRSLSHRTPVEIGAETGRALDERLETSLSAAAQRRLSIRRTVQAGTSVSQRAYEDHVFGLRLPGRDRA
jgi:hypothetical protein